MRTYKNSGKEAKRYLHTFLLFTLLVCLSFRNVQADTIWESGHHEINDGDVYGEIEMHNDATANMWGGEVDILKAFDSGKFSMFGGTIDEIIVRANSIVNIYGGTISRLFVYPGENGLVNLYAYNVVHYPTGGYYNGGWIEGVYVANNQHFSFDLVSPDTSHINFIETVEVKIHPETLNLASEGRWVTCEIFIPEDYNAADVNSASVLLQDEIQPDWIWFHEKQNVLMAKFSRPALQEILEPGEVELTIRGSFENGTYFEGSGTIRVIDKGRKEK